MRLALEVEANATSGAAYRPASNTHLFSREIAVDESGRVRAYALERDGALHGSKQTTHRYCADFDALGAAAYFEPEYASAIGTPQSSVQVTCDPNATTDRRRLDDHALVHFVIDAALFAEHFVNRSAGESTRDAGAKVAARVADAVRNGTLRQAVWKSNLQPTSMCAYSKSLTRKLSLCFENSTRAIDSSKNQPNRLRCDRAREFQSLVGTSQTSG